jgi:hypothetical protein
VNFADAYYRSMSQCTAQERCHCKTVFRTLFLGFSFLCCLSLMDDYLGNNISLTLQLHLPHANCSPFSCKVLATTKNIGFDSQYLFCIYFFHCSALNHLKFRLEFIAFNFSRGVSFTFRRSVKLNTRIKIRVSIYHAHSCSRHSAQHEVLSTDDGSTYTAAELYEVSIHTEHHVFCRGTRARFVAISKTFIHSRDKHIFIRREHHTLHIFLFQQDCRALVFGF